MRRPGISDAARRQALRGTGSDAVSGARAAPPRQNVNDERPAGLPRGAFVVLGCLLREALERDTVLLKEAPPALLEVLVGPALPDPFVDGVTHGLGDGHLVDSRDSFKRLRLLVRETQRHRLGHGLPPGWSGRLRRSVRGRRK